MSRTFKLVPTAGSNKVPRMAEINTLAQSNLGLKIIDFTVEDTSDVVLEKIIAVPSAAGVWWLPRLPLQWRSGGVTYLPH